MCCIARGLEGKTENSSHSPQRTEPGEEMTEDRGEAGVAIKWTARIHTCVGWECNG